jgi:hypothetical protein
MTTENVSAEIERWGPQQWALAVFVWLWVLVPLGYGLYQLIIKIPALFG